MKKTTSSKDLGCNGNVNETKLFMDYDPVHFFRCHSKKNDNSDISTQVWQCAFEPDPTDRKQTTSLVATCGGNSVCFIDVNKGNIILKYYAKDLREMFYALAWTSQEKKHSFLVTGGVRYTVHFIHPASGLAFHLGVVRSTKYKNHINSLLFHPQHWNLLLCGGSHGEIHICHIGNPTPPELHVDFVVMQSFSTNSEVFSMTFCAANNMLLTGCEDGLKGFTFPPDVDGTTDPIQDITLCKFSLPTDQGGSQDLVDSVEAVGNGVIATKCATRGTIYLWNLTDTLSRSNTYDVRPSHLLRWSNTDNYFMFIGVQPEAELICCGDDKGSLWLYDTSRLPNAKPDSPVEVEPDVILPWPHLTDPYTEKKRKLSVDTYDIVVAKVSLASDKNHIVAVTNNNMVCIWQKVQR